MDKIVDFVEKKADKEGILTPLAVAESIVEYIKSNPGYITRLAVVAISDDGVVNTAQSTMTYLELIGLHATAQTIAIEEMSE